MVAARLDALRAKDRLRTLAELRDSDGMTGSIDGRVVTVFCSNDYLGLRQHPAVVSAANAALRRYGTGSGSSRLVAGNLPCHAELENALAEAFEAEAALVFSSGYQANLAVLTTLAGEGDLLCSDELNHASIVDGCRLSRARVQVFPHGDTGALTVALGTPRTGHAWVVVEGLYSMDGDGIDLAECAGAADAAGASLLVDEAHSFGTLGPRGGGACSTGEVDAAVRMGTLGKALGAHGAFVLSDAGVRSLLVSGARSFLYTTALPPASAAAATAAISVMREEPERQVALADNARRVWTGIRGLGLPTSREPSPIVPAVVGSEARALFLAEYLLDAGLFCRAIRPPTVPDDTCRLRLTLSADHTRDQIDRLLGALADGIAALDRRGGLP